MRLDRRGPRWTVFCVAALIALGSCARGSGTPARGQVVVAAGSKTRAAGSFRVTLTSRTVDTDHPSHVEGTSNGGGIVDVARGRGHLSATSTSSDQPDDPTGGAPEQTEIIAIGADVWFKSPPFPEADQGRPWLHHREPSGRPSLGLVGFDPFTLFDRLKTTGNDVREVGQESVRHIATTHYQVSTRLKSSTTSPVFVKDSVLEVWIDGGQLVRRTRLTVRTKAQPRDTPPTPGQTTEQVVELFDFGVPVDVEAPPADQVMEAPTIPEGGTLTLPSITAPTTTVPAPPPANSGPR